MDTKTWIEGALRISAQAGYEVDGVPITFRAPERLSDARVSTPDALKECVADMRGRGTEGDRRAEYAVVTDDSFVAARTHGVGRTIVLNFANAYHPGGGFLAGLTAQEEMLCRCSTLYRSLTSEQAKEMYEYNCAHRGPDCSDYVILSPHVAIFRDVDGSLLREPFYTAVVTSAAPNLYGEERELSDEQVGQIFERKIENILALAAKNEYETIVLGAWGCGAFGNDARDVAQYFYQKLVTERYDRYFRKVIFAVYVPKVARNLYAYRAFQTRFEGNGGQG